MLRPFSTIKIAFKGFFQSKSLYTACIYINVKRIIYVFVCNYDKSSSKLKTRKWYIYIYIYSLSKPINRLKDLSRLSFISTSSSTRANHNRKLFLNKTYIRKKKIQRHFLSHKRRIKVPQ